MGRRAAPVAPLVPTRVWTRARTGRHGPDWPGTNRHVRRPEGRPERTASTWGLVPPLDRLPRPHTAPARHRAPACCTASVCGESPAEPTRKSLRFAYEQFSVLGAHAFAERARIELLATGEKLRPVLLAATGN